MEKSIRKKITHDNFLERVTVIHNHKYDYSKSVIVNTKTKIKIECPFHGFFLQAPANHLSGQGCPVCAQLSRTKTQRFSTKEFIETAKIIHNLKYDYTLVDYINSQTKVAIICKVHGMFLMKPNSHCNGQGCPKCGRKIAKEKIILNYSEFISRAKKIHTNQYEYFEESYTNYTSKMKIFCSKHGFFLQTPHSHISMRTGCPKCGSIKAGISNQKGWDVVLDLFITAHGDKYTYDKNSYKDVSTKVRINCSIHGWFDQTPYQHYAGSGCIECSIKDVHEKQKLSFNEFILKSKEIHGNKFDYKNCDYIDAITPIEIECPKHGFFFQKPRYHYRGSGCPKCISSKGENLIRLILEKHQIPFVEQKKFDGLVHISGLKCDFYLPTYNCIIEYNGVQHYEAIEVFGGIEGLKQTQRRDLVKYEFLERNNINLIIIRFDDNDIENYLLSRIRK